MGRGPSSTGRVDTSTPSASIAPPPPHNLVDARDAVLAERPFATPRTDAVGCRIGRVTKSAQGGAVTYAKEVARILQSHCLACHRPGEIAPFSLTDYRQAAGWSSMIAEVVDGGRMPPWPPRPNTASSPKTPGFQPTRRRRFATGSTPARPKETRQTYPRRSNSSRDGRSPGPTLSWKCPARSRSLPRDRCLTSSSRSTRR
jgi:hypothetical protein